jgi:UDP-4-amino-4,6-dideoxy-N-acetyl-beta-L-altrosamine N-acetyltransferase
MKLEFCKLLEEHLEIVRKWRMSPEVSKYMYTDPVITPEQQRNWYEKLKKDPIRRYWIIRVDADFVGVINFYNIDLINKRCSWAYYLGETSVRGKGVGKQIELNVLSHVFDDLRLNKLCCEVLAFNDLVVKIHQKYGAKIEGKLKKHIYKNGVFHDVIVMGNLKEEWDEMEEKFEFVKVSFE